MALHSGSPLYATAMYSAARSPCASPATSTDSLGDDARASAARSPSTPSASASSKLPGLQFAISHRRGDLRLPLLSNGRAYEPSENVAMNQHHRHHQALYLSMPHCESPHYLPGVPVCPETSPLEKKMPTSATGDLDAHGKKRKKGTRRGTLNAEAKNVLKAWMFSPEHFAHPYPSEEEKEELAIEAGIEVKQLSNWFTNARKRLWQPVLRQSGVEVKNFLSTGRGGPRGNKLDVPANLQHLIAQKEAEDDDDQDDQPLATHSPPSSPCTSDVDARVASLKRSWHEMQAATAPDDVVPKKKKAAAAPARKRSGKKTDEDALASASGPAARTSTATQLSQELRNALAHHLASPVAAADHAASAVNKFKDIEILAAASLIGLHLQPVYQPVH